MGDQVGERWGRTHCILDIMSLSEKTLGLIEGSQVTTAEGSILLQNIRRTGRNSLLIKLLEKQAISYWHGFLRSFGSTY